MTIASLDDYLASSRQVIEYSRTVSRVATTALMVNMFDGVGTPGNGTIAMASPLGIVPVDTDAGYPTIINFAGGALGYVSRISLTCSAAARVLMFDRLWIGGSYNFASGTTVVALNGDPTVINRVPDSDWSQVEIYFEVVTATTGTQTISVVYTDQDGTSRTTPTQAIAATTTVGRLIRVPLFAGGRGIRKIESVIITGGTIGTWNVMLMRRLGETRVYVGGAGEVQDLFKTGLTRAYETSAIIVVSQPDGTASGVIDAKIEIASK